MSEAPTHTVARAATLAVLVAALGYFVDIYDLILFAMVRHPSLVALGVPDAAQTSEGIFLFNMQMGGMMLGGILWGVLGDRRGRLAVLFGSIAIYSGANLVNGYTDSLTVYAACRLIAGVGLAGELGAGITLVSELMSPAQRGVGTTIVAAVGIFGGVIAGFLGGALPGVWGGVNWRSAYYIGGGLGLALLVLRIGVAESGMFHTASRSRATRGNFFALFTSGKRLVRYLAIIAVGVPVWFVVGILFTFSKEIGGALGLSPAPTPATVLFFGYAGAGVGGLASGLLSQWLRSRKRALALFLATNAVWTAAYFLVGGTSLTMFYALAFVGGAATGYWAVFVSTAAELFGTNLRATVTTTVPNFVRGSLVPIALGFQALAAGMGFVTAAISVGVFCLALAIAGLALLPETFGKDLDYLEE
jgi:predicted MFS family arabinose efflux permease